MIGNQTQIMHFPYKTVFDETWDEEWANDWKKITKLFNLVEALESTFNSFEMPILRELSQKKIIIDLQKYAYSLSVWISNKYSEY